MDSMLRGGVLLELWGGLSVELQSSLLLRNSLASETCEQMVVVAQKWSVHAHPFWSLSPVVALTGS